MFITKHYFGVNRPLTNYYEIQIVLEPKQQLSAQCCIQTPSPKQLRQREKYGKYEYFFEITNFGREKKPIATLIFKLLDYLNQMCTQ